MRYPIVAATAAGLALAACSNQPKTPDAALEEFDPPTVQVRGDVVPRQRQRFERLDKNKDGFVTAAEFPRDGDRRLARFDADRDGKVSRSELVEGALRRFDRFDANRDQQVTPQERDVLRNTVE